MSGFLTECLPGGAKMALGTVLHLAPGEDGRLWRDHPADRLHLVEADPEVAETLRQALSGRAGATVTTGAATLSEGEAGRIPLHRHSFPALDAIRPASGVAALYPGLEPRAPLSVPRIDPVALVRALDLSAEGPGINLLAIEAPGEALDILRALDREGLLTGFHRVALQEGRRELYQGGGTVGEARALLLERGYAVGPEQADDADRPWLRADRHPRIATAARLDAEMADLRRGWDRLAEEGAALRDRIGALETARMQDRAERDSLAAECDGLKSDRARLTADLATTRAALETAETALEAHEQDRDRRLEIMRDQMLRTEGQIDFLGGLLFGDTRS